VKLRRRLAVAAALAVLLAALVATGTVAASGITYPPPFNRGAPTGEVTSATSFCPESHPDVTGGGVELIGDNSKLGLDIAKTAPGRGEAKGWKGTAVNDSGSDATVRISPICTKSAHLTYPANHRALPPHTQRDVRMPCPSGAKVIGGGVDASGNGHVGDVASTEPFDGPDRGSARDDGWLGSADNPTDVSQTIFVDAVCAGSGHYKYVDSDRKPLPDNSEVSARARCPAGTNVTGGGIDNSGIEVGAEIANTDPFDTDNDADSHPDDGWEGSAQSKNSGQAERMQAFAICQVPAVHFFSGSFTKSDPDVGPATMSFALTHDGTRIHDWSWHHMPVHCDQGNDVVSSFYRHDVPVADNGTFHVDGVRDPEGFKTTLDGELTHHNKRASGTLFMHGPEPPTSTNCRGTGHWSANVQ
jgi:hypothetical protein